MEFATEELQKTAQMLKDNGMTVYITKWKHEDRKPTYFHFTDGENIGYCQKEWGGVRLSTCHISNKKGQGSGVALQEYMECIYDVTLEDAKEAFSTPGWFLHRYGNPTRYKSWEHYTERNKNNYVKF